MLPVNALPITTPIKPFEISSPEEGVFKDLDVFREIFSSITNLKDFISLKETCKHLRCLSFAIYPSMHFPPQVRLLLGGDFSNKVVSFMCLHVHVNKEPNDPKLLETLKTELFPAFEKRCEEIGINCFKNNFSDIEFMANGNFTKTLVKKIEIVLQQMTNTYSPNLKYSPRMHNISLISLIRDDLSRIIINEMYNTYIKLPAEEITPELFIKMIKLAFYVSYSIDITQTETKIRQDLHKRVGFVTDLRKIISENNNSLKQKTEIIRKDLETKLIKEKESLEAEMLKLRGPNGFNGKINSAYKRIDSSWAQVCNFGGGFNSFYKEDDRTFIYCYDDGEERQVYNCFSPEFSPTIQLRAKKSMDEYVHLCFKSCLLEFNNNVRIFNILKNKLSEITSFDKEKLFGGKYDKVQSYLAEVGSLAGFKAKCETNRMNKFYEELLIEVNPNNAEERSRVLRAIID